MGKRSSDEAPLTPGERVEKWLTNIKTVILLSSMLGFGTLYGNVDAVNTAVNNLIGNNEEALPIPDGQLTTPDPEATESAFRAQVRQSLEALTRAVNANTSAVESTRAYSGALSGEVDKRVDSLEDQLNASDARNFESLQQQLTEIKKLVN
jgi:hypothetical protein